MNRINLIIMTRKTLHLAHWNSYMVSLTQFSIFGVMFRALSEGPHLFRDSTELSVFCFLFLGN